jgi:peptide/nickel transport system substrate-binding protein
MKKINFRIRKNLSFLLVLLSLCVFALAGCGGDDTAGSVSGSAAGGDSGSADSEGVAYKDDLHYATTVQPDVLDLATTTSAAPYQLAAGTIFESLVALASDYSYIPELAETIDISDDAKTITYHLRQGVKFHNGETLAAADVVASLNRWIDLNGDASAMLGEGVYFEEVDDATVKVQSEQPLLYFNDLLAISFQHPSVLPKSAIDAADPETGLVSEYIGTGPYKFDEWVPDQYIKLTKFEDYVPYGEPGSADGWGGYKEALTPNVYFDFVQDDATRVAALQTGEYDYVANLPSASFEQVEALEGYTVGVERTGDSALIYNKQTGLAADKLIRQAINAALNTEDILLAGTGNPELFSLESSYMDSPDSEWYSQAGKEHYNNPDPARVQELLDEAGYEGETFRILTTTDYQAFFDEALVIEQQLEAVGIDTELITGDWATYMSIRSDPTQFDAFITGFDIVNNPSFVLYLSATWAGWADDPTLQDGLQEINLSTDKSAAIAKWNELQEYCWSEYVPASKFGTGYVYYAVPDGIEGFKYFMGFRVWNVRVVED